MLIKLPKEFEGYFGLTKNEVIISAIKSKEEGKGHFSELLNMLFKIRNRIEVPTPSIQMQSILLAKGFHWEVKWFGEGFNCYGKILVKEKNGKVKK